MNKEYCNQIENHLYSFYRKAANHGGLTTKNFSEFSVVSGTPGNWPNYCFNLRIEDNKIPTLSQFMVSEMKLHRVPPFVVVGNAVNQDLVHDFLSKENMKLVMQWSGMATKIEKNFDLPVIADFHIEQVKDTSKLDIYLNLISTQLMRSRIPEKKVFEKFINDPSITMYLAYFKGEPVGTALLFTNNNVAGLYMVSVHESKRGKGIGKALTAQMMNDASQKSCKLVVLHATKDGERIYSKLGFEEYGKINIYWLVGKEYI